MNCPYPGSDRRTARGAIRKRATTLAVLAACAGTACRDPEPLGGQRAAASASAVPPNSSGATEPGTRSAASPGKPEASATVRPAASSRQTESTCPDDMVAIPGGSFWMGSDASAEERPRFETRLAPFCLHRTEVSVAAYAECVTAGICEPAHTKRHFCNAERRGRADHPINCVTWRQADAFCKWKHARLPSEAEWEYAARGGEQQRRYSWGDEKPDGRTCWKHVGGSCERGAYAPGAFDLLDMTGNVWEWTDTWFGAYPWPPVSGHAKVYRGGSWSRRFEKWMSTTLRNRYPVWQWGSHLGFRCALTLNETDCAYGRAPPGDRCLHGVDELSCPRGREFNGARCARPGAPKCRGGWKFRDGHGCVLQGPETEPDRHLDLSGVTRVRSPEFDSDCRQHYPGRPRAYRYTGGTHDALNVVSRRSGCSNRDVGVGWNSCCCP
jgi:formylglycine-generating enzyme required for sulfatase activity